MSIASDSNRLVQPRQRLLPWLRTHTDEVDAVVLDIDGVLMHESKPLPGGRDTVAWLQDRSIPFLLLTNDACNSPEEKVRPMREAGFPLTPDRIASSGHCLAELAARCQWQGKRFFLMGSLGDPCYAAQAGLLTTRDTGDLPSCTGVIIGEKHYNWEQAITAVVNRLVTAPRTPLVVPNPDRVFRAEDEQLCLASGAVARFVQDVCRSQGFHIDPVYLGKPRRPVFRYTHQLLEHARGQGLPPGRVLMVGDSLDADISGGNGFGYRTVLLLSGITSANMLARSRVQPEMVFESL